MCGEDFRIILLLALTRTDKNLEVLMGKSKNSQHFGKDLPFSLTFLMAIPRKVLPIEWCILFLNNGKCHKINIRYIIKSEPWASSEIGKTFKITCICNFLCWHVANTHRNHTFPGGNFKLGCMSRKTCLFSIEYCCAEGTPYVVKGPHHFPA